VRPSRARATSTAARSAPLKAAFGFDAVVGNFASPYAPGSAYVLLHHVFGEVNGKPGQWGHAIGGMGAISEARGGGARRRAPHRAAVARVVKGGRPAGSSSRAATWSRQARVANVNPKLLFERLVARALDADFRARMAGYAAGRGRSG
jgi:phytoene dehydrogenase-like protein